MLDEHESPGGATVHVLHGWVRLRAGDTSWDGSPGDLLIVPDARHGNGPQVGVLALESGVLALESEADQSLTQPYPLDVLVAQTRA